MDKEIVKKVYAEAEYHMKNVNIGYFEGIEKPLFMISETYPGVWLEHLYDSVFFAKLYPEQKEYMRNIIELYIENQKSDGQLPYCILNRAFLSNKTEAAVGYSQIQECVSFGSLCLEAYHMLGDEEFLKKCYSASEAWVCWLEKNRMTQKKGLIEMFCGYDTGHDNSGRVKDLGCPRNVMIDGIRQNAGVLPPDDGISPVIAVDMNCNFYGNLMALSQMALLLGDMDSGRRWKEKAQYVKSRLFEICYDEKDCFFYDADKNGKRRKIKSSTIFHLFLENVLDQQEDSELIKEIYTRHIKNPNEFWTNYPFPSVALDEPTAKEHCEQNSWGYFCQMLIYLRCTLWMDTYGLEKDFDYILERVVEVWTEYFEKIKFAQEIDPVTGIPTKCSEWYSSCMLVYVYGVRRMGLLDENVL